MSFSASSSSGSGSGLSTSQSLVLERVVSRVIREYNDNFGKIHASYATAIALSGLVFLFLSAAFVFPRSVARRTSLYLICLVNLLLCLHCILTMYAFYYSFAGCVTRNFFIKFFEYSALYLIAAIAVNLHLQFHRKSETPLPRYTTYLLFGVPLLVAALHQVPQYADAGAIGICTTALKYTAGTTGYTIYNVFAVILIPAILIVYSAAICIWTIVKLSRRKQSVNKAIYSILQSARKGQDKSAALKEVSRLRIVRGVYSDAIRVSIFPLAPLIWLAMRCAELGLNDMVVTSVYDANRMLSGMYVTGLVMPVFILLCFLLFLADPVFSHLFSKSSSAEDDHITHLLTASDSENNVSISEANAASARFDDKNSMVEDQLGSLAVDPIARKVYSLQDAKLFFKSL